MSRKAFASVALITLAVAGLVVVGFRANAANSPAAASGSAVPTSLVAVTKRDLTDRLDVKGRFALIKFLSGELRAGVSARIAKTALAQAFGCDVSQIEEVWHGLAPPYTELFSWLGGKAEWPDPGRRPTFRPVMLAHPIEEGDWANLVPEEMAAECELWDSTGNDGLAGELVVKRGEVLRCDVGGGLSWLSCHTRSPAKNPLHVALAVNESGLESASTVLIDHARFIDRSRLRKGPPGS